jgi:hypothetical protein
MRWQFEIPTEEQARSTLTDRSFQAEMYRDAVACNRRLMPVTTAAELEENRAWLDARRANQPPENSHG